MRTGGAVTASRTRAHGSRWLQARPRALPSARPVLGRIGWTPVVSVTSAVGLVLVAGAFSAARLGASWALAPFWLGLLTIFVPAAVRLLLPGPSRAERVGVLVVLAVALYLVKIVHSPTSFTFYDELQHWRTLADIASTERLFVENPLLRTSPLFPGMEIVAQAVMSFTGLSPVASGMLVVGLARVTLVLAVFLIFETAVRSTRAAAAGALIYVANPSFLFFDAQFAYESFALPLAAVLVYVLSRRESAPIVTRVGLTVVALLTVAAVVTSHHLTTYVLIAFLIGWTVIRRLVVGQAAGMGPGGIVTLTVVASGAWIAFVATFTISYLSGPVAGAVTGMVRLITREQGGRELFQGATEASIVAEVWERAVGFIGVGLVLVMLFAGCWLAYRRHRTAPLALILAVGALAYPASLVLRFSGSAAEAAARASATVFVGVGLVAGLALAAWVRNRSSARVAVATVACSIIFMSGVIVGWPPWNRLPGPYIVGANARSIEQEGLTAAAWMRDELGRNNRFVADRVNNLLMGSYGGQYSVWYQTVQRDLSPVYFAEEVGDGERELLADTGVEYLVADRRLTEAVPQTGSYFDDAETRDHGPHTEPIPVELLEKFDGTDGMSRIFDSGNIRIYRVAEAAR